MLVRDSTWDADDLKRRVDLRDLVAEVWGPGRKSGKAVMYHARWRDGDRNPSFAVYANGFKDFGGNGDSGDVFTWLQREFGFAFPDALGWLHARIYGGAEPPAPVRRSVTASDEAPPLVWQRAAREALERAQHSLWSDAPEAARVRAYLRRERGLSDATIRAYGLGYNPGWRRTRYRYWSEVYGRIRRARLAPGIVIPWYRSGVLVALRVRCRVGALAAALGRPDDTLRGRPIEKYRSFIGSRLSGVLFGGDCICPDLDALVVEGEFDAMLAAQAVGEHMSAVTPGSATSRLTRRMRDALLACPRVFAVLDTDATGSAAAARLSRALRDHCQTLSLPIGKDVTDYVVTYGGDFARWLAEVTAPVEPEPPALL